MANDELYITEVQKKLNRLKKLEEVRADTIKVCKDITEYILPRRGKYLSLGQTAEQGKSSKYTKIVKNTAARAHRVLKAGLHTGLTNQARPWFRLKLADKHLMKYGPVNEWLNITRDILLDILAGSNFYETAYAFYGEESGFGTACMHIEKDFHDVIRCHLFNMGEYCVISDEKSRVVGIYRRFYMTAENVVNRWKETASRDVRRLAEKPSSKDERVQVVHIIEPRKNRDVGKADSINMPWESSYLEYESHDNEFLERGGYEEFPCPCARWEVIESNDYGDGPGMEILPDVKELQQIEKAAVMAMHKSVDPPMLVPSSFKNRLRRAPGSVNFHDVNKDSQVGPLYQMNFDIPAAESKVNQIVIDIKEAMYNDLFMMISNLEGAQPLTATEVLERREEKMTMLGPVVERNITEFLAPTIERVYAVAARLRRVPPPPPELNGVPVRIELVSMLARALKMVNTQSLQATLNLGLSMYEVKPDIVDIYDFDNTVKIFGDFVDSPAGMFAPDDVVRAKRQARQEEQQKMQQMMELQQGLEMGETASKIKTDEDNALTQAGKALAQ